MAFSCAITDAWGEVTRNWLTRILAA